MKKTIKKISALLLIVTLTIGVCLTLCSFTQNEVEANEYATSDTGTDTIAVPEENEGEDNIFNKLFYEIEAYSSEILSALTFIASLAIMLCYKKGFLPLISGGINALGSGVNGLREQTSKLLGDTESLCKEISDRTASLEESSITMKEGFEKLRASVTANEKSLTEIERLKLVTECQIEMLYEIFMSAALPQYLKESVGEKISKMKSCLKSEEMTDDAQEQ